MDHHNNEELTPEQAAQIAQIKGTDLGDTLNAKGDEYRQEALQVFAASDTVLCLMFDKIDHLPEDQRDKAALSLLALVQAMTGFASVEGRVSPNSGSPETTNCAWRIDGKPSTDLVPAHISKSELLFALNNMDSPPAE